jgi:pyruvate/2-oxoglutarate dehydrogenase complex dihydrolipoamide acyltransferase (E2) component
VKEEDVRAYAAAQIAKPEPAPTAPASAPAPAPAPAPAAPALAPAAAPTPAQGDGASTLPLTHIQRITGQRMLESVQSAPHFYLQVSANMTSRNA